MYSFVNRSGNALRVCVILGISLLIFISAQAEGTRQVSAGVGADAGIGMLVSTEVSAGPYPGSIQANKVRFIMKEGEHFYFGIKAYNRDAIPATVPVYYKIYRSDGVLKVGPSLITTTTGSPGNIESYDEAYNGPIQVYGGGGYNGIGFDPVSGDFSGTGDTTEFYIEIYQAAAGNTANALANQNTVLTYFDFFVADNANANEILGRVYSQAWSFITYNYFDPFAGDYFAPANEPYSGLQTLALQDVDFYGYTTDRYLSRIHFTEIYPLAFVIYFNQYGTDNSITNWEQGRRSSYYRSVDQNNNPNPPVALDNGYNVFLSEPDPSVFTQATAPTSPSISGTIAGCPPSSYKVRVTTFERGDVQVVLDFGNPVEPARRRYLYAYDQPAGVVEVAWDGRDGLGTLYDNSQPLTASSVSKVLRGRTNLPIFDAETNPGGIKVENYNGPGQIDATLPPLYWNDSLVVDNNYTVCPDNQVQYRENNSSGRGYNVSELGVTQNGFGHRGWNGSVGNPLDRNPPAPPITDNGVNGQATAQLCDDFGNNRILNTWWWVSQSSSSTQQPLAFPTSYSGCSLPVTLLGFSGQRVNNEARLNWETVSEESFSRFVIERSTDGTNFLSVGSVPAAGRARNSYVFTDYIAGITAPRIFYRLRMIDTNGSFRYSRTVMLLTNNSDEFSITNLRNPVSGQVAFQANTSVAGAALIQISDASGKGVYKVTQQLSPGANAIQLREMPLLADGIYLMSVEFNGVRQVQKLVVTHR